MQRGASAGYLELRQQRRSPLLVYRHLNLSIISRADSRRYLLIVTCNFAPSFDVTATPQYRQRAFQVPLHNLRIVAQTNPYPHDDDVDADQRTKRPLSQQIQIQVQLGITLSPFLLPLLRVTVSVPDSSFSLV